MVKIVPKKLMNPKLNINQPVFCACNNLECEGICRRTYLIKWAFAPSESGHKSEAIHTGEHCTAAFNKSTNRDRRVKVKENYSFFGVDWAFGRDKTVVSKVSKRK